MSYETNARKCNEMLALARAGSVVWWRRGGFNQSEFRGVEPKWHILTGRDVPGENPAKGHRTDGIWIALCGYKKSFSEGIFEQFPKLKKRAPKKDTRCSSCVAELPAYKPQLEKMARKAAAAAEAAGVAPSGGGPE